MKLIMTVAFIVVVVIMFAYYKTIYSSKMRDVKSSGGTVNIYNVEKRGFITVPIIIKTDAEWGKLLTPEQYKITVKRGTEKPFANKYYNNKKKGIYRCVRCGTDLFSSDQKYDSGSGWPSFTAPVSEKNVVSHDHRTLLGMRTQVLCARCGAYLGEVFDDGPPPAHKRYCMDSPAFEFVEVLPGDNVMRH